MEITVPRWKGKGFDRTAGSAPLSQIVDQLRCYPSKFGSVCARIAGCGAILLAEAELAGLLSSSCFGQPFVTSETRGQQQWFQLSPEEAFYMSCHLKCLRVADAEDNVMSEQELWGHFKSRAAEFPEQYKAYAHLRAKNWVVRPGSQYGVDFVAYRHHPSLVHSEYAVVVQSRLRRDGDADGPRLRVWPDLQGALRVSGCVAKTLLVLTVAFDDDATEEYTVEEHVIKRWVPDLCREVGEDGTLPPTTADG